MATEVLSTPTTNLMHLDEVKNHLRVTTTSEDVLIEYLLRAATDKAEGFTKRGFLMRKYRKWMDNFTPFIELGNNPLIKVNSIKYIDTAGVLQTLDSSLYKVDRYASKAIIQPEYNKSWPTTRGFINDVQITYQSGYMACVDIDHQTSLFTVVDNPFSDGDIVHLHGSDGNDKQLPTGLTEYTDYHVINTSGDTFQVSLTEGGSAVSIGGEGSGIFFVGFTHIPDPILQAIKLMITDWYYNRGNVNQVIPEASYNLLMPYAIESF